MAGGPIRALPEEEGGFAIVEVLVAMAIFAVIAVGFAGTMAASLQTQLTTRSRTTAVQLATEQLERARSIPYEDLGTEQGNPPGDVKAVDHVSVDSASYTVNTTVEYVDDPIPGGYQTAANYKRVVVTVTDRRGRELARLQTNVAPPTQPSLTKGLVKVRVIDPIQGGPVANVVVRLAGGPSGLRTGTTRTDGYVTFAALTPTTTEKPAYKAEVITGGWTTYREDLPSTANAGGALVPTQTLPVVLRVYRAGTVHVEVTQGGVRYPGTATVALRSPRGVDVVTFTGGFVDVTSIDGEPIVPSETYEVGVAAGSLFTARSSVTFAGYPVLTATDAAGALAATPATRSLLVQVRSAGQPVAGRAVVAKGLGNQALVGGRTGADGNVVLTVPYAAGASYEVTAGAVTVTQVMGSQATTTATVNL